MDLKKLSQSRCFLTVHCLRQHSSLPQHILWCKRGAYQPYPGFDKNKYRHKLKVGRHRDGNLPVVIYGGRNAAPEYYRNNQPYNPRVL